jgi:hypothetical protein
MDAMLSKPTSPTNGADDDEEIDGEASAGDDVGAGGEKEGDNAATIDEGAATTLPSASDIAAALDEGESQDVQTVEVMDGAHLTEPEEVTQTPIEAFQLDDEFVRLRFFVLWFYVQCMLCVLSLCFAVFIVVMG